MSLSYATIHAIRTSGRHDTYWAGKLKVTRGTIRQARIGETWAGHPTPPDVTPRGFKRGGRPRKPDDSSEVRL